jgi:hypothetical protein
MNEYATLDSFRQYLSLASADTSDDTQLKDFLRDASRAIDEHTFRKFYPTRTSALKYDIPKGGTLRTNEDLLEIKGLSDLNGASVISSNVAWLKTGDEWNLTPYDRIILDDSSGSAFNYSGTPQRAIRLDAIVGYHKEYNQAWRYSSVSLTSDMTATGITASVSGSAGDDAWGSPSRIQAMNIVKIDEEFMFVTQGGQGASTFNVVRGINGTSATTHASGASIYVWKVEQDIETATKELASFYYAQAKSPYTQRMANAITGMVTLPDTMLPSTERRLSRFIKRRVYSF